MPLSIKISGATLLPLVALLLASLAVSAVVIAGEDPAGQVSSEDHSQHQMDHSGHVMPATPPDTTVKPDTTGTPVGRSQAAAQGSERN